MKRELKMISIVIFIISLLYPVIGEVAKLPIGTDSSWKTLDSETMGWTSENYDDSWWEPAAESSNRSVIETGMPIWYPGKIQPNTVYFRKAFEINGTEILTGKLYVGLQYSKGNIDLYLNNNSIEKITDSYETPAEIDIVSYLKPETNILAARVSTPDHNCGVNPSK
jgi:hypothetical protein